MSDISGRTRQKLLWTAKLTFGVLLLGLLVYKADPGEVVGSLRRIHPGWLVAMFAVPHLGIVLSTAKWQILLKALGVVARFPRLLSLYLVGTFFNNFLPSMVGGDVVRAYQLGREERSSSSVVAATFMERFIGLGALVTLLVAVFFQPVLLENFPYVRLLVGGALLAYAGATWFIFSRFGIRLSTSDWKWGLARRLMRVARDARQKLRTYAGAKRELALSYLISAVFYLLAGVTVWLAGKSLGIELDLAYLAVAVPLVLLAGLIPVSVNGLGITEAGYTVVLGAVGVPTAEAVSLALLIRLRVLFTAVVGGACFVWYRPQASPPADLEKPSLQKSS